MKILIPVLSMGNAGGYRVLSKLADELILLGHQVEFLCPNYSPLPYFPTKAIINWVDIDGVVSQNYIVYPGKQENFLSIQKKLYRGIKKIFRSGKYDVIIANHSLTTFPIALAGLTSQTLYYIQAYEPEMFALMKGTKNKILGLISRLSYKFNFFTVVNADIYLNYKGLHSSRVLYPGVDFNLFYPSKKNIQNKNKIIIGTIGRLEPFKGTIYVLQAFQEIRKKFPDAELFVAFGNEKDFVGYSNIHCVQPHGDEALSNFYKSLDYYICAGFIQLGAFHYPVVEAMSCGIPVITTSYYPANNTNAWITHPFNALDIVNQFDEAEKNIIEKANRIKRALADIEQFDWTIVGKKMDVFLKELTFKTLEQ